MRCFNLATANPNVDIGHWLHSDIIWRIFIS